MIRYTQDEEMVVHEADLSEGQEAELASYLLEQLEQAERDREPFERRWKAHKLQYEARLSREDAGGSKSNLDMPTTKEFAQQIISRLVHPILAEDEMFVTKPRNPSKREAAAIYEAVVDWVSDRTDWVHLLPESVEEVCVYPTCVMKVPYEKKTRQARRWRRADVEAGEGASFRSFVEEVRTVVEKEGPFPSVVPCPDFFFPLSAPTVKDAEWVCERSWPSRENVEALVRDGIYRPDSLDRIGDPERVGHKQWGLERTSREAEKNGSLSDQHKKTAVAYEVLEFWVRWGSDPSKPREELIVTIEKGSETVLRAVKNFYHDHVRPFVTWSYQPIRGSIYGYSLAHVLEPLHRAYSTSVNQRLDTASLANTPLVIAPKGSDLGRMFTEREVLGGFYETATPTDQVRQFNISQGFSQLPQLEGLFREHMSRMVGVTDYNFGQETIERPTATGQIQLIQEGQRPLLILLERFRDFLVSVVKMQVSRLMQFNPGQIEIVTQVSSDDPTASSLASQVLQWPEAWLDDMLIETKVSSGKLNKMLRRQESLAIVDKMPQIYEVMSGLYQMAMQPSPLQPWMWQLARGYQMAVGAMIDEFEIPNPEAMNPDAEQSLQLGQVIFQQFQQLSGENAQLQQQNAQLMQQMQMFAGGPLGGPSGAGVAPPPGMAPQQGNPGMDPMAPTPQGNPIP